MPTRCKAYFYRKICLAKQYMDQHFAEELDIDQIANQACFSKYNFIRQFKKTYHRTPYQYLKFIRLHRAAILLRSGQYSVQEVCFLVGYISLSSFSGLFKSAYDQSPHKYLQAHKARARQQAIGPSCVIPACFATLQNGIKQQF
ncbi:AraC family transcriptional regulator [Bowmanella denitrificans]|uniref:AraC family transcriptional regulator n=1 Tax=Bowmanella denitrificans TaxID=366582 RepID=UPI000C9AA4D6|nr:AraC family transcriptional regulator [Bowmanella denitrificans]